MQKITQEELSTVVQENQKSITDLQTKLKRLEAVVFCNSPGKAAKLERIVELAELNQSVTVTVVKNEFKIRSSNYAREILKEAAKLHGLIFFKGQPGLESYVTKHEPQNKAMNAYSEIYEYLLGEPIGTEMTEGAIAHKYKLNGQELQSVIGHLARHNELHIVLPRNRNGLRRVKRVR